MSGENAKAFYMGRGILKSGRQIPAQRCGGSEPKLRRRCSSWNGRGFLVIRPTCLKQPPKPVRDQRLSI